VHLTPYMPFHDGMMSGIVGLGGIRNGSWELIVHTSGWCVGIAINKPSLENKGFWRNEVTISVHRLK
jgi:hypothetical protein